MNTHNFKDPLPPGYTVKWDDEGQYYIWQDEKGEEGIAFPDELMAYNSAWRYYNYITGQPIIKK